mgnify:CR=1 FL=1
MGKWSRWLRGVVTLGAFLIGCSVVWAEEPSSQSNPGQEQLVDEMQRLEIESRMLSFYDQMHALSTDISHSAPDKLTEANQQVTTIDTKWNAYYQARQSVIADDDSLLQIVANYQLVKQTVLDSIAAKQHYFDAQKSFAEAEAFCLAQDSIYQALNKKAVEYSLVKSAAPQLEQLKGEEQSLFAEVQQQYETAKNLSQEFPVFQPRFQQIEEKYIELKNRSEKIQALEYKPWIERVKDYLYSLAAVAMILMFINMVQAKIKTLKQARENAKKLREALHKEEDDYPTI